MGIIKRLVKAAARAVGIEIRRRSDVWSWNYNPRRGDAYIITPLIEAYLEKKGAHISFLSGGSGAHDDYFAIIARSLSKRTTRLYGFEIDPDDCKGLNEASAREGTKHSFFPVGLWSHNGEVSAFVTRVAAGSSLYEPNSELIQRLAYGDGASLAEELEVVATPTVPVTTVDSWARQQGISELDFINLNIQGGELDVLRGAVEMLPSVLGIQIEMAFNQTYIGAPGFSGVDQFLIERGFQFFDMLAPNYIGRKASPVTIKNVKGGEIFRWPSRQLFEGVFLYLRDPIAEADDVKWSADRILKLAAIAEAYGQVEYAFELLAYSIHNLKRSENAVGTAEVSLIENIARRLYENLPQP